MFFFGVLGVLVVSVLASYAVTARCRGPLAISLLVGLSCLSLCLVLLLFARYYGMGGLP